MKRAAYTIVVLICCLLLNSCNGLENVVYLKSDLPAVINEVITGDQDTVTICSSPTFTHPPLNEPDCDDNAAYMIYKIQSYKNGDPYSITLESVSVIECGKPLPFSVFYRKLGNNWREDKTVTIDTIPFIYNISNRHYGDIYIKIKKRYRDISEITIRYRIITDGKAVEAEHQYRRIHEINTRLFGNLYRRWRCKCED